MKTLIKFYALVMTVPLFGGLLQNTFEGVRPTGMGNAFIALADDANALWYNPAGLANIEGVHVNLFNFFLGVDSKDTLDRIHKAIFKGDSANLVRQDKQFLRFNFMPSVIMPHFGVSIFSQTKGYFDISDILNTGLKAHTYHDQGLIAGGAFNLTESLSLGVSVRAFYRGGVDLELTSDEVIDQYGANAVDLVDNIYQEISNRSGHGYAIALNAGIKMKVPLKSKGRNSPSLFLAATAEDIGNTTFKAMESHLPPNAVKQSFHFGSALIYPFHKSWTWNITADLRNAFDHTDIIKLLHAGTELKNPIFGLRMGANQGYLAYGLTFEFPPHTRLHFSSYGVETGDKARTHEQRWYLIQLNIGFNPN
ncbi:MAG: hypothetical protein EBR01_07660 [Proteobacteria bacterium]|nr:hypothetical protein [Pseudomonadota bacterium]